MIQLSRVGRTRCLLKRSLSRLDYCCCFRRRLTSTQRVCPHHGTMQRQSLGLIQMDQCLCTTLYLQPFIMYTASHVHRIPDFKAPEASTERTSPLCVNEEKTPQDSSPRHVEIVCNSSKKPRTYAEHGSTSSQALRANNRIIFRILNVHYFTGNA